jgi:hypothetical protein
MDNKNLSHEAAEQDILESLNLETQKKCRDMAIAITKMLGETKSPVLHHLVTLSMALAEVIHFCPAEARDTLIKFHNVSTQAIINMMEDMDRDGTKH